MSTASTSVNSAQHFAAAAQDRFLSIDSPHALNKGNEGRLLTSRSSDSIAHSDATSHDHMSEVSSLKSTSPYNSDTASVASSGNMSPFSSGDSFEGQSSSFKSDRKKVMLSQMGRDWKERNKPVFASITKDYESLLKELNELANATSDFDYKRRIETAIYFLEGYQYNYETQCELYDVFLDGNLGADKGEVLTQENLTKRTEDLRNEIKRDIEYCRNTVEDIKLKKEHARKIEPILSSLDTMKWLTSRAPRTKKQAGANFSQ
ncbi:MAG: hypothetical protein K2W94_00395 [Alphaproteobacteria bacterium]|nr:hypothetical protein [Alphaproteobacteria bacterium]